MKFLNIRSHEPEGWHCCGGKWWAGTNCGRCQRPDPRVRWYGC